MTEVFAETPSPGEQVAVEVRVHGRVQGVGFRYFAHDRACRLQLVGYVQNLPDGGVRTYAEGARASLEQFAAHLQQGPAGSRVTRVQVEWRPVTGQYERFSIEPTI
jgi:acylphosphatase